MSEHKPIFSFLRPDLDEIEESALFKRKRNKLKEEEEEEEEEEEIMRNYEPFLLLNGKK